MRWLLRFCTFALSALLLIASASRVANAATPTPTSPGTESVASIDPLAKQVDEAIRVSARRYLNAEQHTPWQIVHGILALRQDYVLQLGDKKVNAIEWVSNGP